MCLSVSISVSNIVIYSPLRNSQLLLIDRLLIVVKEVIVLIDYYCVLVINLE